MKKVLMNSAIRALSNPHKVNIGCGANYLSGWINVDRNQTLPSDEQWDITNTWPFDDATVQEINASHVLEHVGPAPKDFLFVMKEMYRVLIPEGVIHVKVPHPRSDSFLTDPTHVRPILPQTMRLFDQAFNVETVKAGWGTTPLGLQCGVNFFLETINFELLAEWQHLAEKSEKDRLQIVNSYDNVINEIGMKLVKKPLDPARLELPGYGGA